MTDHRLLDVQRLDTEAEQLRHRRDSLEQRALREAAVAETARLEDELAILAATRVEVATRQKRLEDEAQIFSTKAGEDESRLYGGDVGMKDLQALQEEIAGLRARQGELEDRAIEAMEEAEDLGGQVGENDAARSAAATRLTVLDAEIAEAEAEIDAALADVAAQRDAAVGELGSDDLARYERLRPGFGSAAVVRFDGSNCVGCPSTMPAMELDRMKRSEAGLLLDCSECGRIVVT